MPAVAGRTPDARTASGVVTTATSTALTAPVGTFGAGDVGRTITGTGIPAGATLTAVTATGNGATLSAAATAAGTIAASLGAGSPAVLGFRGWSPETEAEALALSVTGRNTGLVDPAQIINRDFTASQRSRA